ncbi:LysM peptidoglycan-binding domain-containing protein [Flavicella sp.]|uniref:LysM peptidoglycan-binding domain-containing protein n=1 Tax=Flavicella sp. TaxID=2957742 RepID=UPI00301803A5
MKKIVLLFVFCLYTFLTAFGQQKEFISYTVKKGESVRKIAKRYELRSKDILRVNPGLNRRPQANTVILIPNVNYNEEEEKARVEAKKARVEAEKEILNSQNHIIQAKETLYGVSKLYNVSIESLKELNSDILIEGLKIGMVIEIPKEKMLSPEEVRQNEFNYWAEYFVLHTVVKDDTSYSLTRHYNVSEDELLSLNPKLTEGLKLGMVLKIKDILNEDRLLELDELVFLDSIVTKDAIDVAMLLPFKFPKNDTLSKEQLFTNKDNLVSIITDFYLGATIAMDSIRNQGVSVNLNVYDTENDRYIIDSLIKTKQLDNKDVVFGPVFNEHVNRVARKLKGTPVIFPFYSSEQNIFVEDNIVKTVTSRKLLKEEVLKYLVGIYKSEHIVLVGDEKLSSRKELRQIGKYLKEKNNSIKNISFIQPENGYINNDRFVQELDALGVNWVILTTNDKVVTADVINNLKSIPSDAEVRLFAFEKGNNFDKVDNNILADMNFVYASSGFLIDSIPEVSGFYAQYLRKYKSYPSEYASKGFDVVYDVLMRMSSNDSLNLSASFKNGNSKRVRSSFKYEQKAYGEPVYNTAVYLRKFNEDLSVELLSLERDKKEKELTDKALSIEGVESIYTETNNFD